MERKITFSPGEFYHVYNRGVEKRKIFLETKDYERFFKMLFLANSSKPVIFKTFQGRPLGEGELGEKKIAIGAYALMPNHFHILVKEIVRGGLTTFMLKLTTAYAMYFNKKYERVGPLFQGKFKAEHIDNDNYLKYLFAYIHLNPIKIMEPNWKETGITDIKQAEMFLNNYRYSSYHAYVDKQKTVDATLSPNEFPDYFTAKHAFIDFQKEWLASKSNPPRAALG